MSSGRVRAACAALCLVSLVRAPALAAQGDSLLVRRDALRARAESLAARVDQLEAAARDSGLVVTVQAMGYSLRTTTTLEPVATAALAQAAGVARELLGSEADSLTRRVHFTLRESWSLYRTSLLPFSRPTVATTRGLLAQVSLEATMDARGVAGTTLPYPVDRDELAADILNVLERAVALRLPDPVAPWLNTRVPLRATMSSVSAELYRALATADAAVVRRCVAGDRRACRTGFALDSMPADRIGAWYDDSDLPTLARTAGDAMQRSWMYQHLSRDEQDACVGERRPEACRHMLSLIPPEAFRIPMPDAARASLARLAMEIGGPQAVSRLRTSSAATVGGQLAAAAGIPADELLGRWMQQVIAARPHSPLPGVVFVVASLACIGVCLGWAMRSAPWR
jgi:hypothetical protein